MRCYAFEPRFSAGTPDTISSPVQQGTVSMLHSVQFTQAGKLNCLCN